MLDTQGKYPVLRVFGETDPADISLDMMGEGFHRYFTDAPAANIVMGAVGISTRRFTFETQSVSSFRIGMNGSYNRKLQVSALPANMGLHLLGYLRAKYYAQASAVFNLNIAGLARPLGFSTIELPGFVIPRNGDLIIDTGEMTVMLNGQDVTRFFGADSEFFKLRPGENIIVYTDDVAARNVSITFLWKDRWI
jgi:hypothetical protein